MSMVDVLMSTGIRDIVKGKKRDTIWLPGGLTLAQYSGYSNQYQPKLDVLIDGVITDVQITFTIPLATGDIKASAVTGSRVRRGLDVLFEVPTAAENWGAYVPSYKQSKLDAGNMLADSQTAVWLDALIGGLDVSGTTIVATDGHGEPLTAALKGVEAQRK